MLKQPLSVQVFEFETRTAVERRYNPAMSQAGSFLQTLWILLFFSFLSIAAADPPPTVTPEQEFIAEQQALLAEEFKQVPVLPARAISDIVRMRLTNGNLSFELLAKDVEDIGTIPLAGLNGVCQIQRFGAVPFDNDSLRISIHVIDQKSFRASTVMLSSVGGRMNLDVTLQSPQQSTMTQFILGRATPFETEDVDARLYIQVSSENDAATVPAVQRSAETAAKLLATNHSVLLPATGEGFRLLQATHLLAGLNEREVRHMLAANVEVSSEVARDIRNALEQIRQQPEVGESRLRSVLANAGPSAVAAMARVSRDKWTVDQTVRVDTILSEFVPGDPRDLDVLRTEPSRLVDMLYWPDEGIRKAVMKQLVSLTGIVVTIDPSVDPYAQSDDIERYRAQLRTRS